jgi:hypothetical protein
MLRGKKAEGGKVNKMEAVRQVIAKHGKDTMPTEIAKFVKEEHGADMSVDMASTYKSAVLRKKKGKRGPKPGWKTAAAPANGAQAPGRHLGCQESVRPAWGCKGAATGSGASVVVAHDA